MKLEYPIRINKYLAQNNYSTRVGADELIKKGLVFINGQKAILGDKVCEGDEVTVNDKNVKKAYVYYAYHKAKNIVTNAPQKGEKDIMASEGKQTASFASVSVNERLDPCDTRDTFTPHTYNATKSSL